MVADEWVKRRRDEKGEAAQESDGRHDKEALALAGLLHFVSDATIGGFRDAFDAERMPCSVAAKTFSAHEIAR